MSQSMTIGVLALQGAFKLHEPHIQATGAHYHEVTTADDLNKIDALILPGGESSVILKLISLLEIEKPLHDFMLKKPVWGICAGAILLAKEVFNPTQSSFKMIDVDIERNSYGSQVDSFEEIINDYRVSFIRAPKIVRASNNINIMATHNNYPVWVEKDPVMITTFHPETNLNFPSPWHERFIGVTRKHHLNNKVLMD